MHSVSLKCISHHSKTAKMKILLQYGITNHICKLLHLYQMIGWYKCANLLMWFVILYCNKIFIFAVLEWCLIHFNETWCSFVYLILLLLKVFKFDTKNGHFALLSPIGGLRAMYAVHRLIEKLLLDFLLVLIELFSARCYSWGATSEYLFKICNFAPTGAGWPKISGRRGCPHQPFFFSEK